MVRKICPPIGTSVFGRGFRSRSGSGTGRPWLNPPRASAPRAGRRRCSERRGPGTGGASGTAGGPGAGEGRPRYISRRGPWYRAPLEIRSGTGPAPASARALSAGPWYRAPLALPRRGLGHRSQHARASPVPGPLAKNVCVSARSKKGPGGRDPASGVPGPSQYFGAEQKGGHHSTRGSRVIPQRSTNLAQLCLTAEIGRDRVHSEWFDRGMSDRKCRGAI